MTAAEYCFIDTNVLLTASDKDRPNHTAAVHFLESGLRGEKRLFTNGQVFREYLVVATRSVENNGFGLSPNDALSNLHTFSTSIQLLNESQAVAQKLHKLAADYQLKGKRIHDANIVATMLENGLTHLKTYNQSDFTAFDFIQFAWAKWSFHSKIIIQARVLHFATPSGSAESNAVLALDIRAS